ncbi:MAG: hypothetical protein IJC15_01725 [Clostridia bacterium]|nr:hypothetical protein [Clostridia bacterium]
MIAKKARHCKMSIQKSHRACNPGEYAI